MSHDVLLATTEAVRRQLTEMLGHPVRVTVLEPQNRERAFRVPGILARVSEDRLTVETSQVLPTSLVGAATVEILAGGCLYWGSSALVTIQGPQSLTLPLPQSLQSGQRRRHARIDLDTPVSLYVEQLNRTVPADLRDLSAGGASLRTAEYVATGRQVRIAFRMGSGMFLQNVGGEVLRCSPAADGRYALALKFLCDKEQEAVIAAWVDAQLQAKGAPGSA